MIDLLVVKNNLSYSLMGSDITEVVINSTNIRLKVTYRTSNALYVREAFN